MFDSLLQGNVWKSKGLELAFLLHFQDMSHLSLAEETSKVDLETDFQETEKEKNIKAERGFQIRGVSFVNNDNNTTIEGDDNMTIKDDNNTTIKDDNNTTIEDEDQQDPTYSPNTLAAIYPCEKCGKHFKNPRGVEAHLKKHLKTEDDQQQTFECTICSKTVSSKYILATHMKSHNNDDRELCNICSKSFANKYILKYHIQAHSEEKKTTQHNLPCSVCLKSFSNKYLLKQHKKTHDADVLCNICSKLVANGFLQIHMKNMHGENIHIPCSNCGLNYKISGILKHQKLCKSTEEERKARKAAMTKNCERCGKVLCNTFKLRKHMEICAE